VGHFDEKSKVFSFAVLYNERGVGSLYNKISMPALKANESKFG
jgi:hypothetical protein